MTHFRKYWISCNSKNEEIKMFLFRLPPKLVALCLYGLSVAFWLITVNSFARNGRINDATSPVSSSSDLVMDLAISTKIEVVNCRRLFDGYESEILKALQYQVENPKLVISEQQYMRATKDCDEFVAAHHYITSSLTDEEADFPLAFSILLYKDIEQFERLLRTIYRPQNEYCIHIDKKSDSSFHDAVKAIVHCFENVFVLSQQVDVVWGNYSVLEPEILCMEALLKFSKKWKYFINLTGQEFPLKTNYELVQILKSFNGSNHAEGTVKRRNSWRTKDRPPPPIDVVLTKGSVHIVASRGFVEYAVYNESAVKFLEWCKSIYHPDEMFFSTLNHNPSLRVPGSYLGLPETDLMTHPMTYPWIGRYTIWHGYNWPCHGKFVRFVCVFGVGDLPLMGNRRELFVNKLYLEFQYLTINCMEELINNRTRDEFLGKTRFSSSYYEELPFVKNHI